MVIRCCITGFITKQTGLPPAEVAEGGPPGVVHYQEDTGQRIGTVPPAEERSVEDAEYGCEAGATEHSAKVAGSAHGVADSELHAGFITKQTPL